MPRYPQCVLATCAIPWTQNERLDEIAFRTEVRRMRQWFQDLYVFGTAGEGHAVDLARFHEVCAVFAEEMREARPQAGVIAPSTPLVRERIRIAYDLGFRTFQISLPFWGVLRDSEIVRFFSEVCGEFADCSFLHYNVARSGRLLDAAMYRRIADLCPNLVGTKITGSDESLARELMSQAGELQHFFVRLFPFASRIGECSLLSAHAPHSPREVLRLFANASERPHIAARLDQFDSEVFAHVRGCGYVDGAFDKVRIRCAGVDFPLRMLPPWEPFEQPDADRCVAIARERFADILE